VKAMDASHSRPAPTRRRTTGQRRRGAVAAACALLAGVTGCGNFSANASTFTAQPSLTAPMVTPVIPQQLPDSNAPRASTSSPGSSSTGSTRSSTPAKPDPCVPTDPAVIAACLSVPWGLAPLPDGVSALVGERTTGRILRIAAGTKPVLVTTLAGIDARGDGGLLGIAVSPSYSEDGLIYAYVTTATDNRVLRIAAGDNPKAILTGIPKGSRHNGGALAFTGRGVLYVGTGDTGAAPEIAGTSLAGKLLRIDEFGKPATGNPKPTSPIFSSGFSQITGFCLLPTGAMAAVDHRIAADVLLPAAATKNYATLNSGDAVWNWKASDGGAADCAYASGLLVNSSLAKQHLAGVAMSAAGSFSGTPRVLLDNRYGRLLTVQAGAKNSLWMTTSNKDGHGKPVPADDRVIVLPDAGGAGGGSPD
jgi:hypothetical protein